jgi:hypothetical protein
MYLRTFSELEALEAEVKLGSKGIAKQFQALAKQNLKPNEKKIMQPTLIVLQ